MTSTGSRPAAPHPTPFAAREAAWLPLLRELSEASDLHVFAGRVEEAFDGTGDVDLVAPEPHFGSIERAFVRRATEYGSLPVIVCEHHPAAVLMLAAGTEDGTMLELEVRERRYFRGRCLFRPEDMTPLSIQDPRGFRRTRPGAEGLVKLVSTKLTLSGEPRWEGIRKKGIVEMLRSDPEGVREAAPLFGSAAPHALRVAEACLQGRWDRRAALAVQAAAAGGALSRPASLLRRAGARGRAVRRCEVRRWLARHGRRVPRQLDEWLDSVERDHTVYRRSAAEAES